MAQKVWFHEDDMINTHHACCAAWLDGHLYVVSRPGDPTVAERWDGSEWEAIPSTSVDHADAQAASANGLVFVFGGRGPNNSTTATDAVEAFDPDTGSWSLREPMPEARYDQAVVNVGDVIHVFSGSASGNNHQLDHWVYDPTLDSWTVLPDMPFAHRETDAALVDSTIYLPGGLDSSGSTERVSTYNVDTGTWGTAPDLPSPRTGLGVAAFGSEVYVVGGITPGGSIIDDTLVLKGDTWIDEATMPGGGRYHGDLVYTQGSLSYVGGRTSVEQRSHMRYLLNAWRIGSIGGAPT